MMQPGRPGAWSVLGLLALLNLALYAPSLDNGFSLDDYNWLERAEFCSSPLDFILRAEPGQILSPVSRALFFGLHLAAGAEPLPYRLAVLSLHVLAAFLLFALAGRLARDRRIGVLAAVLFSLHTAYDEALFWVAAFFHPLAAVFVIGTLVAFVGFLDRPRARLAVAASALFLAGCLTKASAFTALAPAALCLLLPGVDAERRRSGARLLAGLAGIAGALLLANLATGAAGSYLLARGYYSVGLHMAANFGHYAASLLLPFAEVFARLGLDHGYAVLFNALRWIAPVALSALFVAGSRQLRVPLGLALAGLVPFLPFVFEPVSRYTYLASAGIAGAAALLVHDLVRLRRHEAAARRALRPAAVLALGALLLVSAADTRLRDNIYEHRERLMAAWIDDVSLAAPGIPPGTTLRIVGLPHLAVDPGIHLEAALRLHYGDPELDLRVLEAAPPATDDGILLEYRDGRIRPVPRTGLNPRRPGTTG
jgi:hypothetical protein